MECGLRADCGRIGSPRHAKVIYLVDRRPEEGGTRLRSATLRSLVSLLPEKGHKHSGKLHDHIYLIGIPLAEIIETGRRAYWRGDKPTLTRLEKLYELQIRGERGMPNKISSFLERGGTENCKRVAAQIISLSTGTTLSVGTILDYMRKPRPASMTAEQLNQRKSLFAAIRSGQPRAVPTNRLMHEQVLSASPGTERPGSSFHDLTLRYIPDTGFFGFIPPTAQPEQIQSGGLVSLSPGGGKTHTLGVLAVAHALSILKGLLFPPSHAV